jgi:hypothetical protein
VFTTALHWSLSWASSIQSDYCCLYSLLRECLRSRCLTTMTFVYCYRNGPYVTILLRVGRVIRDFYTGFRLDDWKYLHIHNLELQAIQRYCWSTYFTVHRYTRTRVLCLHQSHPRNGFITVSLSLQITHEVFFSQPNSFLFPLFCNCQFRRLNAIQLLRSQALILRLLLR